MGGGGKNHHMTVEKRNPLLEERTELTAGEEPPLIK